MLRDPYKCVGWTDPSVGVLQCSKPLHKVVHNISLGQTLTLPSVASTASSPFLLSLCVLLLTQRSASLHWHKRCTTRLEPRRNPAQCLALPALLLLFPRAEVVLAARVVRRDRGTAVRFHGDNVGLEREGVDELEGWGEGRRVRCFVFVYARACGMAKSVRKAK